MPHWRVALQSIYDTLQKVLMNYFLLNLTESSATWRFGTLAGLIREHIFIIHVLWDNGTSACRCLSLPDHKLSAIFWLQLSKWQKYLQEHVGLERYTNLCTKSIHIWTAFLLLTNPNLTMRFFFMQGATGRKDGNLLWNQISHDYPNNGE